MKVKICNKAGRILHKTLTMDRVVAACLNELLRSHDSLYKSIFGEASNPHWDIAAKNARVLYEALMKNEQLPALTIDCEFLSNDENLYESV